MPSKYCLSVCVFFSKQKGGGGKSKRKTVAEPIYTIYDRQLQTPIGS